MTEQDNAALDRLSSLADRLHELEDVQEVEFLQHRLPSHGGRALDVGCGTGYFTAYLAGRFDEVLAIGTSGPLLAYARTHHSVSNIRYVHRDLDALVEPTDGRFDLVFSFQALHQVADPAVALTQIRGRARPGGQVILIDRTDHRGRLVRHRLRAEARSTLLLDLRYRRRPVEHAVELYRLSTDSVILANRSAAPILTPAVFEAVCGATFLGAEFISLQRTTAMHWRQRRPTIAHHRDQPEER